MVRVQTNSQGKVYTSGDKALLVNEIGNIITATNNSSSAVASGEKVWIEPTTSGGVTTYAIKDYYSTTKNYTAVGSMTINDSTGVASGFSNSSYVQFARYFDYSQPWEFRTKLKYKVQGSEWNTFIITSSGTNAASLKSIGFALMTTGTAVSPSNFISFFVNTNTEVRIDTPDSTLVDNTDIWIKAGWNGTAYYISYSYDGENYTTLTSTNANVSSQTNATALIGNSLWMTNCPWQGDIYLKDTMMLQNGKVVWYPYVENITQKYLTGKATQAIAVSSSGSVSTVF